MQYTIVNEGMGGAFNPPGHAEHHYSVRDGYGSMSLRYALTCSYVPDHVKTAIRDLLSKVPGTLTEEWVLEVYRYYGRCYSPDGVNRNISACVKSGPPEWSLAHLHIVQFFPDYSPRLDLMENWK